MPSGIDLSIFDASLYERLSRQYSRWLQEQRNEQAIYQVPVPEEETPTFTVDEVTPARSSFYDVSFRRPAQPATYHPEPRPTGPKKRLTLKCQYCKKRVKKEINCECDWTKNFGPRVIYAGGFMPKPVLGNQGTT